ncbi:MAG: lamin tail domain-containing protein [Haloferacaceae archaeon]
MPSTVTVRPVEVADSGGLRVTKIHPNPAGSGGATLAEEIVVLRNTGATTVDLGGWTIGDGTGTTRTLAPLATPENRRLQPGERLVVHTGAGRPTAGHLYLAHPNELWGDGGGMVRLVNRRVAPSRTITVRYGDATEGPTHDVRRATELRPLPRS